MQRKIEGIVISVVDYKESSKIINIFSNDEGIVGVIARGSRKLKSHLRTTTNVLSYGIFYVNDRNKGLPVVTEVDIIDYFKEIRKDFLKMNYALFLLELTSQVYKHDNNKGIYKMLISGLLKINEGYDVVAITNIIEIKLLDNLGIKPNLESCTVCSSKNDIITISSYRGGYLCSKCCGNEYKYNLKVLKLIKLFYYVNIDNISKLDISSEVKRELNLFIEDYYDRYSGLYLKSKKVLDSLSGV